ncbi:hypothetical protein GGS24DRAFT_228317 [Hypoxylon argillaceum]|nr:hypothetical protein GGS24DRAFT_228317 [Hypoxylon argillaceum]
MTFSDILDDSVPAHHHPINTLAKDSTSSKIQQCKPQRPCGKTSTRPSYTHPTASSSARTRFSKSRQPSSLSSLSRSRIRGPLATPRPSDVIASDPEYTAWLWKAVMSFRNHTASSRGKTVGTSSLTGSVVPTSTLSSQQHGRQTASTSAPVSASSRRNKQEAAAKVTDADFMESVLEPYGITIKEQGIEMDLRKCFDILELPNEPESRLNIYKQLFAHDVWLEPTVDRIGYIRREYKAMHVYGSNEAEYSASALRDLFLDGPRYPWLPEEEGEKCWLPVRMLQFVCKPPQDGWHIPPLIHPPKKRYEWDIRPDCAYYVSLQAFKSELRAAIQHHVSVTQQRAFSPYLTIEFKRDEGSIATARYQVAVASSIALYNRFRLKAAALEATQSQWSERHKNQMRHYGITFTASRWQLWCTVPKTFPDWTGCIMSSLHTGNCCILAGVQKLVSAINDIHYWGLEIHGKSCKADIYAKVHSFPGAGLNDISLLEDGPE